MPVHDDRMFWCTTLGRAIEYDRPFEAKLTYRFSDSGDCLVVIAGVTLIRYKVSKEQGDYLLTKFVSGGERR